MKKWFSNLTPGQKAIVSAACITAIATIIAGFLQRSQDYETKKMEINATQTAEAKLTSIAYSLASTVLPSASTFTPSPTLTATPTIIKASEPTNTSTSTALPTPDIHLGFNESCIDKQYWTPFSDQNNGGEFVTDDNNCWLLAGWGFIAQDNGLYMLHSLSDQGQQTAIYSPIPNNSEISFLIRVNILQTSNERQAYIRFGIVPDNPPNRSEGEFIAYHYLPSYPNSLSVRLWHGGNFDLPSIGALTMGNTQKIVITPQGSFLSISINDNVVVDKLVLSFEDRLFWVDFYLPPYSKLSAFIYDFSIQGK